MHSNNIKQLVDFISLDIMTIKIVDRAEFMLEQMMLYHSLTLSLSLSLFNVYEA